MGLAEIVDFSEDIKWLYEQEGPPGSVGTVSDYDSSNNFFFLPWVVNSGVPAAENDVPKRATQSSQCTAVVWLHDYSWNRGCMVRVRQGVEGGDSNSCREEDGK